MIAARGGKDKLVAKLLEAGANVYLVDKQQKNALHHALERKKRRVVAQLINVGGEQLVAMKTAEGYSGADLASSFGSVRRQSMHALVSFEFKKPQVADRAENQFKKREKKNKEGKKRDVSLKLDAWGIDLDRSWKGKGKSASGFLEELEQESLGWDESSEDDLPPLPFNDKGKEKIRGRGGRGRGSNQNTFRGKRRGK